MTALTIRTATVADADAMAAIYAHYVLHSVATFDTVPPDPATWAAKVRDGELPFRVGEVDGAIAGFAYLSPYRPKAAYRHTAEDTVYVAPQFLGRGYGRLLLTDVLECAAGTDLRQLIAVIADGGDGASERLHAALGFTVVGRLTAVGCKFDRWIDTVLMQRDVPR
jgi:L-amino acid N-acyltransferase YncA